MFLSYLRSPSYAKIRDNATWFWRQFIKQIFTFLLDCTSYSCLLKCSPCRNSRNHLVIQLVLMKNLGLQF
ncbi:hypothetical protein MtrunA17_Chr7g0265061 [Medicago truncatula]|uniref:Uncharacterized protein n=1 Tax=Medicago truncatula TaxID=3880 RepID=A0A396H6Y7_MEDTR|nr:hypothetical protein MtrunA17_Chr7g0265061 [Medicago truncatula]